MNAERRRELLDAGLSRIDHDRLALLPYLILRGQSHLNHSSEMDKPTA
jgi:hypothetical protein